MADYNDIKQSIATNLPDNNKREITAARLRDTLNGFVDKVQETETGIEGNVTNLTGRVGSLEETVANLPSGDTVKVVDNPGFGGVKDASSARWVNVIAALTGMWNAESEYGDNFMIGKATVHPGYIDEWGRIQDVEGYSYFEYRSQMSDNGGQYITFPAYGGDYAYTTPEGRNVRCYFYRGDGDHGISGVNYDANQCRQNIWPREVLVPEGANMMRGSLVNGTFDPDGIYVVESQEPNNCHIARNLNNLVVKQELTKDYEGAISENGELWSDAQYVSIVKLFKNDELEWEIAQDRGPWLAIGDSNSTGNIQRTVIYKGGFFEYQGWAYYKADRDCYAFIAGGGTYKITHNDHFNNNLQDKLNALITRIDPEFGEITLDKQGKGVHKRLTSGTKIVCKVPIIAGSTLNYTLHSTGTFTLGPVAYYYNGQPVATENIENQATFNANVFGIVGGTKSGYMLVTFVYSGEGDIPAETFNATYLEKNAQ